MVPVVVQTISSRPMVAVVLWGFSLSRVVTEADAGALLLLLSIALYTIELDTALMLCYISNQGTHKINHTAHGSYVFACMRGCCIIGALIWVNVQLAAWKCR